MSWIYGTRSHLSAAKPGGSGLERASSSIRLEQLPVEQGNSIENNKYHANFAALIDSTNNLIIHVLYMLQSWF